MTMDAATRARIDAIVAEVPPHELCILPMSTTLIGSCACEKFWFESAGHDATSRNAIIRAHELHEQGVEK